jgi:hypothetical protein
MTGRPKRPREFDRRFWAGIRAGLGVEAAALAAGMSESWGRSTLRKAGGVNPTRATGPVGRYLSLTAFQPLLRKRHACYEGRRGSPVIGRPTRHFQGSVGLSTDAVEAGGPGAWRREVLPRLSEGCPRPCRARPLPR